MHIVETRMFCTVCLKPSCLLICFHFWNLDLSQTLKQTIQILKEEKTGPKPWKKITPGHLSSLSSDPLHGSFFFLFSRGFCNLGPRTPQNPWKNQKQKNKQTKITRCHLSSFSSDPLHGSIFFCFVEVFATVSIQQYQLLIFLCFLFSCFLGSWEKFSP